MHFCFRSLHSSLTPVPRITLHLAPAWVGLTMRCGANRLTVRRSPWLRSAFNFLRRADARQRGLLGQNPVVAVQAGQIDASEVPGLIYQLSSGQVANAVTYYSSDPDDPTAVPVKFLLLFDSRTGRLVSPEGVLVIDTPARGIIANFGGVQAVFADTGWW
jgi:hypothetical protein